MASSLEQRLYLHRKDAGRMPEARGSPERITTMDGLHEPFLSPDGTKLAVLHSSDTSPTELYLLETEGANQERRITHSPPDAFYEYRRASLRHLRKPYRRLHAARPRCGTARAGAGKEISRHPGAAILQHGTQPLGALESDTTTVPLPRRRLHRFPFKAPPSSRNRFRKPAFPLRSRHAARGLGGRRLPRVLGRRPRLRRSRRRSGCRVLWSRRE